MIAANYNHEAGAWMCRKIDFVRSMGLNDEARNIINQSLKYPEICLKYYNELMAVNRWQDAVDLLDKAQELKKENSQGWFGSISPDWPSMKHNLLMKYGTKEMQIANLIEMFHYSIDDKKTNCYMMLKELVAEEDWKDFYTDLLSRKPICFGFELDSIALFLIIEKEWEWLYRVLEHNEQRDKTYYRHPLKYASALM